MDRARGKPEKNRRKVLIQRSEGREVYQTDKFSLLIKQRFRLKPSGAIWHKILFLKDTIGYFKPLDRYGSPLKWNYSQVLGRFMTIYWDSTTNLFIKKAHFFTFVCYFKTKILIWTGPTTIPLPPSNFKFPKTK